MSGWSLSIVIKGPKPRKGSIMLKIALLALLVSGIFLIIYGLSASSSASSDILKIFTETNLNNARWMLFGGAAATSFGFVGLAAVSS
jgi:hypothetical protein